MVVPEWESRTASLLGDEAVERLASAHVVVVGVGGVGGYAVEILARSGVGRLTLIDADRVAVSNINRQLIATAENVGKEKTALFAARIRAINPEAKVEAVCEFLTPDNMESLVSADADFVIDAIDTVAPKVALIAMCLGRGQKIVSSMGAGGRLDPSKVRYADIFDTREDGLARAVRQRLKKMGIRKRLQVVTSDETPRSYAVIPLEERNKRSSFGTTATIPAIFGIYLANHVVVKLSKVTESTFKI